MPTPNVPPEVMAILAKHPKEWAEFQKGGGMEVEGGLYEDLFDYYFFTVGEMPYGTAKARTGDPVQWIKHKLQAAVTGE